MESRRGYRAPSAVIVDLVQIDLFIGSAEKQDVDVDFTQTGWGE